MHTGEQNARRSPPPLRKPRVDLRLSLVGEAMAVPWRFAPSPGGDELATREVLSAAEAASRRPGAFLLSGGNPLRRGDLWELLGGLVRLRPDDLGVSSLGHGITESVIRRLRAAGVQRVHIPFHCARQDAHDWLVGRPGALKTAHRAIRACLAAGMPVVAEIVLTRPTAPHLAETVEVLARLGVRALCVRRLSAWDVDPVTFVPLSPRLGLLERSLEQAAAVAIGRRVRLRLRDLPLCVAPRLRPLFAAPDSEGWVMPDGTVRLRAEAGAGCAACPGSPQCAGAPRDYVSRFGWEEFADPGITAERLREDVEGQRAGHASAPMAFTWGGPHRVRCAACADDVGDAPNAQPPVESTRVVRARLVQAAGYRPSVARLVGAELLAHPEAPHLLYDAVRLFPAVEVAGEASAVAEWSDLDLRRLKPLQRFDVALYGPDAAAHDAHCGIPGAFAAMLRGVERLRRQAQVPIGAYAILHDAREVPAFAEAWSRGALPGKPRFRLSARGASLEELVECVRALPPSPARAALAAVLPRCLCEQAGLAAHGFDAATPHALPHQQIQQGRSVPYSPCGSDPIGAFDACQDGAEPCPIPSCPGMALGWQRPARSERWTVNI